MNLEERLIVLQTDCHNVGYIANKMSDPTVANAIYNLATVVKDLIVIVREVIKQETNE